MVEDKRILITGGAGFIGTHLAERLYEANEVTLLDIDLQHVLRYWPLADEPRIAKIEGDVRDRRMVDAAVEGADIVLHLASILGVQKVIDYARDTIDTTVLGTRNVLEAARKSGRIERLVNISTSEVFGDATHAAEGDPASVGTANDPRLCYASSKLLAEHLVWAYCRDFGIPTVNIRPFNIYGPRRTTRNAVGLFIVKALSGRDLTLYGDGSQLRSWCYVDDFCNGILACLDQEAAAGEDFNIGNPTTAATIYELARRVIDLTESDSQLVTTEHPFSDIGARSLNAHKSRRVLGYAAQVGLDEGLRRTIDWHRKHLQDFSDWL